MHFGALAQKMGRAPSARAFLEPLRGNLRQMEKPSEPRCAGRWQTAEPGPKPCGLRRALRARGVQTGLRVTPTGRRVLNQNPGGSKAPGWAAPARIYIALAAPRRTLDYSRRTVILFAQRFKGLSEKTRPATPPEFAKAASPRGVVPTPPFTREM